MKLVVMGGSTGGLEAMEVIFRRLPEALTAAYCLVLHRIAEPSSQLADHVAYSLGRAVIEPDDDQPLRSGSIYLAPGDYHMLVEPGRLRLDTSAPDSFARPSIDALFFSAADAYERNLTAVLLSGASADGAAGLAHVNFRGGMTIVQHPKTAKSAVALQAALQRMKPSHLRAPEHIAELLR